MASFLHFAPRSEVSLSAEEVCRNLCGASFDCSLEREAVADESAIIGFAGTSDTLYLAVEEGRVRRVELSPDNASTERLSEAIMEALARMGYEYQDDE